MSTPPRKRSLSGPSGSVKKKKYSCKFQADWMNYFQFLRPSSIGNESAFCTLCSINFSVASGGLYDIKRHVKTEGHKKADEATKNTKSMGLFFPKPNDKFESQLIMAETLFSNFVAEHNLPFVVADHFTELCSKLFPDSKIASKFACKRTKCTQIIKRAIAPSIEDRVVQICKKQPFSILCDESNDRGVDKCFAILVRVFDEISKKATTFFLDMPIVNIGSGENLFNALDKCLSSRDIPWSNVIGFASDNCNVMKGKSNSVLSRIQQVQPHIMDIGCICHLANLCCSAGVKVIPIQVDEMIVDIFYHFHQSAKRKEVYKSFLEFCDVEPLKILKHASTRWLSLQKTVSRTLHHWPAMLSYFNSHEDVEKPGKVRKIAQLLSNPEVKLYFLFLEFILAPMNEFNTAFQADAVKIGMLHDHIHRLLKKFLSKFVKISIISKSNQITDVPYSVTENQHDDDHIAVGITTRTFLADNKDDISPHVIKTFFRTVRNFYIKVTEKIIKKFPFGDTTLRDLAFLNPENRTHLSSDCVVNIASRFPQILASDEQDKLTDEFLEFQLASQIELPKWKEGEPDIEAFWSEMCEITDIFSKTPRYLTLSKLALACVVLPNSNADSERIFSMLKKIQTEHRSELANDTICSLICAKQNQNLPCYDYCPDLEVIRKSKSACMDYNNELQK